MLESGIIKAKKVLDTGVTQIIIGSETLTNPDFLNQAEKAFGANRIVVSIDLKDGKVLSISKIIRSEDPTAFAEELEDIGINRVIILGLDRICTEIGINLKVLRNVLKNTKIDILVGGAIRGVNELEDLRKIDVSGALVATVLHNGKLNINELKSKGFLT